MDTSFNGRGYSTAGVNQTGGSERQNAYMSVVALSDGNYFAAGYAWDEDGMGTVTSNVTAAKFSSADGTLVTDFGTNGYLNASFAGSTFSDAMGAVETGSETVLVTGRVGSVSKVLLAQFNSATGELDKNFGNSGNKTYDFAPGGERGVDLAWRSDGTFVVVGYSDAGIWLIGSYNSTGYPDASFGNTTLDLGGSDRAHGVALDNSGNVLVVGESTVNGDQDVALVRYTPTGSLDSSFGSGGKVITDLGGVEVGQKVAVQSDGKIVVAGYQGSNVLMLRYTSAGVLDTTYGPGGNGTVTSDFGSCFAYGLTLQSANDYAVIAGVNDNDMLLARYNATAASVDPTVSTLNEWGMIFITLLIGTAVVWRRKQNE